jgi:hypothetical protein
MAGPGGVSRWRWSTAASSWAPRLGARPECADAGRSLNYNADGPYGLALSRAPDGASICKGGPRVRTSVEWWSGRSYVCGGVRRAEPAGCWARSTGAPNEDGARARAPLDAGGPVAVGTDDVDVHRAPGLSEPRRARIRADSRADPCACPILRRRWQKARTVADVSPGRGEGRRSTGDEVREGHPGSHGLVVPFSGSCPKGKPRPSHPTDHVGIPFASWWSSCARSAPASTAPSYREGVEAGVSGATPRTCSRTLPAAICSPIGAARADISRRAGAPTDAVSDRAHTSTSAGDEQGAMTKNQNWRP